MVESQGLGFFHRMGRKRRKELRRDDEDNDDCDDDSSSAEHQDDVDDDDDDSSQEIVNVDFEFFDPKPDDFHGLKALLKTYLHETEWDLGGFVDLILGQTTVGTVVKAGEDQGPIGFITALNVRRYKDSPAMQDVGKFLMSNSCDSRLEKLWNGKKNVGLLVTERVVNVPLEVCQPLYQGLFDEIKWATEDEPSAELRDSFKFQHYIILTKVYQEVRTKKAKKKKSKQASEGEDGELVFIKPEDKIFLQLSSFSSKFAVKPGAMSGHETKGLKLFALVMAVKAKQVGSFQSRLKSMLESPDTSTL